MAPSHDEESSWARCLQFTKGDLQCGDLLSYLLSSKKIDTVLHFAAQVCTSFPHAIHNFEGCIL